MSIEDILMKNITKKVKKEIKIIERKDPTYFYSDPNDKAQYLTNRMKFLKKDFLEAFEKTDFTPINSPCSKPDLRYGFISSLNGEKITTESCYLFNTLDKSNIPVKLDLSNCKGFSIFNQQIVVVKGTNLTGAEIIVEKIYSLYSLNYSKFSKFSLELSVAKGPFAPGFESLFDKVSDVLILLGPFLDLNANPDFTMDDLCDKLNQRMMANPRFKVIVVPSSDDYCSISTFPQPAAVLPNPNIIALPNPGFLEIDNHFVVISNFDSILDLGYEELFKDSKDSKDILSTTDKMQRLSTHILFQRSFVPTFSKSDVSYGEWLNFEVPPHLLILSSKMKHFSNKIAYSTIVNAANSKVLNISSKNEPGEYNVELIM